MKSKVLNTVLQYLLITAMAILLAFNYQLFIVENSFAPAGLNGIATMIQYKTGFSIGYMSLIINIPLCIFAFFTVERKFALRSLVFSVTYSLVFIVIQSIGFENLQYKANGHDTIFPVILSGVISGIVYGVCFRLTSSTGGTDIVSKFINKKKPELNFFWITFTINAVIAAASFFVYAEPDVAGNMLYNYKPVCLCVLYCFISSYVGNYMIKGTKRAYEITVITSHGSEIAADIRENLKHSSTRISATGTYSNSEKTMLICVINKHQLVDFRNILQKYDDTFAFSEIVTETYGKFARVK